MIFIVGLNNHNNRKFLRNALYVSFTLPPPQAPRRTSTYAVRIRMHFIASQLICLMIHKSKISIHPKSMNKRKITEFALIVRAKGPKQRLPSGKWWETWWLILSIYIPFGAHQTDLPSYTFVLVFILISHRFSNIFSVCVFFKLTECSKKKKKKKQKKTNRIRNESERIRKSQFVVRVVFVCAHVFIRSHGGLQNSKLKPCCLCIAQKNTNKRGKKNNKYTQQHTYENNERELFCCLERVKSFSAQCDLPHVMIYE